MPEQHVESHSRVSILANPISETEIPDSARKGNIVRGKQADSRNKISDYSRHPHALVYTKYACQKVIAQSLLKTINDQIRFHYRFGSPLRRPDTKPKVKERLAVPSV